VGHRSSIDSSRFPRCGFNPTEDDQAPNEGAAQVCDLARTNTVFDKADSRPNPPEPLGYELADCNRVEHLPRLAAVPIPLCRQFSAAPLPAYSKSHAAYRTPQKTFRLLRAFQGTRQDHQALEKERVQQPHRRVRTLVVVVRHPAHSAAWSLAARSCTASSNRRCRVMVATGGVLVAANLASSWNLRTGTPPFIRPIATSPALH